jgi:hypothetical protein
METKKKCMNWPEILKECVKKPSSTKDFTQETYKDCLHRMAEKLNCKIEFSKCDCKIHIRNF